MSCTYLAPHNSISITEDVYSLLALKSGDDVEDIAYDSSHTISGQATSSSHNDES